MTRTKALLVVGCIMLALAVLAALELRQETTEPSGQAVTGLINKTEPPAQTLAELPRPGALVPLDQGTLRPDESKPAALPGQPDAGQIPAQVESTPVAPAPAVNPEQVKPEPIKTEQAKPEPVKNDIVKPEQMKPEQAKPVAPAPVATSEPKKAEQAKPEQAKPEQVKPEQAKPESAQDDKDEKDAVTRAIDTAGPVKVEKGQKAIVWTRLELADKSVVFRLSGAEKVEGKAFVLPDPDRYVVDLQGDWAMRLPAVPKNAFIKKIRVGKYGDNTRMVLDLSGTRNCQMVRINPTTLEFRIR